MHTHAYMHTHALIYILVYINTNSENIYHHTDIYRHTYRYTNASNLTHESTQQHLQGRKQYEYLHDMTIIRFTATRGKCTVDGKGSVVSLVFTETRNIPSFHSP